MKSLGVAKIPQGYVEIPNMMDVSRMLHYPLRRKIKATIIILETEGFDGITSAVIISSNCKTALYR